MAFLDNYLDFSGILVNEVIGDFFLFAMLLLITVGFIAVKKKIPFEVMQILFLLGFVTIYKVTGLELFYIVAVLIAAFIFFYYLAKAVD